MYIKDRKVVIINSDDRENNLTDGYLNLLGDVNEDISHSELMIQYGLKKYGTDSIFGILNDGYYLPVYPAFFLTESLGNVVFLNISNNKMGKQGLLYLPSNLSELQMDALNSLSKELKGFNIEVNNNLILDDGIVDCSQSYIVCDGKSNIIPKKLKKRH